MSVRSFFFCLCETEVSSTTPHRRSETGCLLWRLKKQKLTRTKCAQTDVVSLRLPRVCLGSGGIRSGDSFRRSTEFDSVARRASEKPKGRQNTVEEEMCVCEEWKQSDILHPEILGWLNSQNGKTTSWNLFAAITLIRRQPAGQSLLSRHGDRNRGRTRVFVSVLQKKNKKKWVRLLVEKWLFCCRLKISLWRFTSVVWHVYKLLDNFTNKQTKTAKQVNKQITANKIK